LLAETAQDEHGIDFLIALAARGASLRGLGRRDEAREAIAQALQITG